MNPMNRKRVLIVDDEADLVELLESRLEDNDYDVLKAYDGLEALEKARREKPDLVLLDLMLPKIDGYKVCKLLKADRERSNLPIILLSAKAQQEDIRLGREAGADAYVTKPFESEELLGRIRQLITFTEEALGEEERLGPR